MMQAAKSYLLSLVAASLLCALVRALLPKGAARRALSIGCALLLALTALRPLTKMNIESFSAALSRVKTDAEAARSGVRLQNNDLVCAIIKQECEAYISDKAERLGLTLQVSVSVSETGTYPHPTAVTLIGAATPQQQAALTEDIANNLAIPKEAQTWKTK